LREVAERAYRTLGRRTLTVEELRPLLPPILALLARRGAHDQGPLKSLHLRAAAEALEDLEAGYRAEVIAGGTPATAFIHARKIEAAAWSRFRQLVPDAFPELESQPLVGERLLGVARLYADLVAGRINATAFYARAKISVGQLRILQASDPRFARPEGTPSWGTVKGRRDARDLTPKELAALSARWRERVLNAGISQAEFGREEGRDKKVLERIIADHPELFSKPAPATDAEVAAQVGARAQAFFDENPLIKQEELVDALNRDAKVVAVGGALTLTRYQQLRAAHPGPFPDLRDQRAILERLAGPVRAALGAEPTLSPSELTARMQRRFPRFKLSRVYDLRRAGLLAHEAVPRPTAEVRRADAERLARLMTEQPERPIAELAEDLAREDPRFNRDYLYRLRKDFEPLFRVGPLARGTPVFDRPPRLAAELIGLAVRLSPPGASEAEVIARSSRLLARMGLPGFAGGRLQRSVAEAVRARYGGLAEQNARTMAEVAAEYAQAAPRGASEVQIVEAIRRDYPSIDAFKWTTYKKLWAASPARYPAVAALFSRARAGRELVGMGRRPAVARFLGGWEPKRALFDAAARDPRLAAELARRSQYARITPRLPLLDEMVAQLGGAKPLAHHRVLWISHLLGSTVALGRALTAAGASASGTIVVGSPYGSNQAVAETMRGDGFDVRVPPLSAEAYRAHVERALDDILKQRASNQEPILVLDDGGLVTEILHDSPKYKDVVSAFKIVEQTTRGHDAAERRVLKTPVVSIARADSKIAEGAFIGRAVAAKMKQALRRQGMNLKGLKVTIVGHGVTGAPLAEELAGAGAIVTVVEKAEAAAREAAKRYPVRELDEALDDADLVIGTTGDTSIKLEHLRKLKDGAVVVSASSRQVEIEMAQLRRAASSRRVMPGSTLVGLPTVRYRLGGRGLTVLGDGWPINFDGDVDSVPPEEIQITRAAMFAAALQAAGLKAHQLAGRRVIPLDPGRDRWILTRFNELRRDQPAPPISDPDDWRAALAEVVDRMTAAGDGR
jgi:adenosylhomocysteinase